jgi:hypothetical protein
MDDYQLPDNGMTALKRFHMTIKVKLADKVKAVYSLGSGL